MGGAEGRRLMGCRGAGSHSTPQLGIGAPHGVPYSRLHGPSVPRTWQSLSQLSSHVGPGMLTAPGVGGAGAEGPSLPGLSPGLPDQEMQVTAASCPALEAQQNCQ